MLGNFRFKEYFDGMLEFHLLVDREAMVGLFEECCEFEGSGIDQGEGSANGLRKRLMRG